MRIGRLTLVIIVSIVLGISLISFPIYQDVGSLFILIAIVSIIIKGFLKWKDNHGGLNNALSSWWQEYLENRRISAAKRREEREIYRRGHAIGKGMEEGKMEARRRAEEEKRRRRIAQRTHRQFFGD